MNEYRNSLGFINITPLVKSNDLYSSHCVFTYEGKKYYYKSIVNIKNIYNELIAEEIAKDLGIPCAHYDLAVKNNLVGVISENFVQENEKFILIEFLLNKYFYSESRFHSLDEYNNFDDIWDVLIMQYKDCKIVNKLMDDIIKIFIYDVLIANIDRHCANIGIIESEDSIKLAPLFDNERMLHEIPIIFGGYGLAVRREDYFSSELDVSPHNSFLENFLNIGIDKYLEQFESSLWVIDKHNIKKILDRVSTKVNAPLNSRIISEMLTDFQKNREKIEKTIKKVKLNKKTYVK